MAEKKIRNIPIIVVPRDQSSLKRNSKNQIQQRKNGQTTKASSNSQSLERRRISASRLQAQTEAHPLDPGAMFSMNQVLVARSKKPSPNFNYWVQEMLHLELDTPEEIDAEIKRMVREQRAAGIKAQQKKSAKKRWTFATARIKIVNFMAKFALGKKMKKAIEYTITK